MKAKVVLAVFVAVCVSLAFELYRSLMALITLILTAMVVSQ